MENAVRIRPYDSVVTVTEPIAKGGSVFYTGCQGPLIARNDIPIYHKIAIVELSKGSDVYKYGEKIGVASEHILVGEHVHIHNITSTRA